MMSREMFISFPLKNKPILAFFYKKNGQIWPFKYTIHHHQENYKNRDRLLPQEGNHPHLLH